ncbi:hypothetical protein L7F22_052077 [Adiantum nelumboides]|nr:hypothetical protein [Adiantum nelumboides]
MPRPSRAATQTTGTISRAGGTGAESLLSNAVTTAGAGGAAASGALAGAGGGQASSEAAPSNDGRLLTKRKVQELVAEIDGNERLEGDVEDLLLEVADEFVESVTQFACRLAKHRKGDRLEVRDVQLHLERSWNLRIPTPGSVPVPPPRIRGVGTAATQKGTGGAGGGGASGGWRDSRC